MISLSPVWSFIHLRLSQTQLGQYAFLSYEKVSNDPSTGYSAQVGPRYRVIDFSSYSMNKKKK